jgi:uncharacterized protein YqjF (DUF2071 family)
MAFSERVWSAFGCGDRAMLLPTIRGVIDRRILVNYRVDPEVAARLLPAPFRPKLANGHAIAGICLIRLKQLRPRFVPIAIGIGSENAAHRFAVEWDHEGTPQEGVFIPRRDTSSRLNTIVGGRLFPGVHHHARFEVGESKDRLRVEFESDDRRASASVEARLADGLSADSAFGSLDEASRFFERGALGYSTTNNATRFDGLELRCTKWTVQPLTIEAVRSSYFDDRAMFPEGSATIDCALLMRDVEHEWHMRESLCPASTNASTQL